MSKTSEISRQSGLSRRTLQYYDDEGILVLQRTANNYRVYDQNALQRIWEILLCKEMGLKLREIRAFLALPQTEQRRELQRHLKRLEGQIGTLEVQKGFVLQMMRFGMSGAPDTAEGTTYVEAIARMREEMEEKIGNVRKAEGEVWM